MDPNKTTFYTKLQVYIGDLRSESIIICGDFNLVLNYALAYYNYRHANNLDGRQKVLERIDDNYCVVPL